MARNTVHDQYLISYLFYLVIWNLFHPEITPEEAAQQLNLDISCILAIWQIRYLQADLWLSQSPVHWIWHGSTSKMNLTTIVSQICSMLPLQSFRFCMISFKNILYSAITQIIPKPQSKLNLLSLSIVWDTMGMEPPWRTLLRFQGYLKAHCVQPCCKHASMYY